MLILCGRSFLFYQLGWYFITLFLWCLKICSPPLGIDNNIKTINRGGHELVGLIAEASIRSQAIKISAQAIVPQCVCTRDAKVLWPIVGFGDRSIFCCHISPSFKHFSIWYQLHIVVHHHPDYMWAEQPTHPKHVAAAHVDSNNNINLHSIRPCIYTITCNKRKSHLCTILMLLLHEPSVRCNQFLEPIKNFSSVEIYGLLLKVVTALIISCQQC